MPELQICHSVLLTSFHCKLNMQVNLGTNTLQNSDSKDKQLFILAH